MTKLKFYYQLLCYRVWFRIFCYADDLQLYADKKASWYYEHKDSVISDYLEEEDDKLRANWNGN